LLGQRFRPKEAGWTDHGDDYPSPPSFQQVKIGRGQHIPPPTPLTNRPHL
jgi:hypothetical protein